MNIVIRTRINELTLKAGISKIKLARLLQIDISNIKRWNKGESMPSMSNIINILEIFECEISDLFEKIPMARKMRPFQNL